MYPSLGLSIKMCTLPQGSVFVEFEDQSDAEKFLSLDVVKFRDTELIKESKYVPLL